MTGQYAILLCAFGTRHTEALAKYDLLTNAFQNAFPHITVTCAFTSPRVRAALAARQYSIFSPEEAVRHLIKKGMTKILVQSLHIVAGEEFHKMIQNVSDAAKGEAEIKIGRPLLVTRQDIEQLSHALYHAQPEGRTPNDAWILMGHGHQDGRCDTVYMAAAAILKKIDPLIWITTVENPYTFSETITEVKAKGIQNAYVSPLMIIAGEHAKEDMAGVNPNSLTSLLKSAGLNGIPDFRGLASLPETAHILIRHAQNALGKEYHDS